MVRYVKGALVKCLDEYGREVARGVTNEAGRVVLRGIPTGTYTLKVLTPEGYEAECQIERLRADADVLVFILSRVMAPDGGAKWAYTGILEPINSLTLSGVNGSSVSASPRHGRINITVVPNDYCSVRRLLKPEAVSDEFVGEVGLSFDYTWSFRGFMTLSVPDATQPNKSTQVLLLAGHPTTQVQGFGVDIYPHLEEPSLYVAVIDDGKGIFVEKLLHTGFKNISLAWEMRHVPNVGVDYKVMLLDISTGKEYTFSGSIREQVLSGPVIGRCLWGIFVSNSRYSTDNLVVRLGPLSIVIS